MAGDAIQQIKEKLSIVDVIAPFAELHPAGKNMKARCPFHSEKTPSFIVSPDRGMYHCYGCGVGGDIFTFIQEIEGVDFKEALKILAARAGVELVPEDPKKRGERDKVFDLLEDTTKFFIEQLNKNQSAEDYLKQRGLTKESVVGWRLGYAPGPPQFGWRELRNHLKQLGYTDAQALKAGLIKDAGEGKEPYDVFRDRLMFPIFDSTGKPIAFSGRILSKDSDAPKYVNSPETDFFNKSQVLYGFDRAKQGIRKFDFSLIVEGQFDVVLAHQAGYNNTVAVSGTAMTDHHASLLQRLSNRVVLALDADRAGIAAVKRSAEIMLSRGMDVKVAALPEGSDPADLVANEPTQFKKTIGAAKHVIEFLLQVIKAQAKDDRNYKLQVREEVLPYIAKMDNRIDAEHFTQVVAKAIGTGLEAVRLEVERIVNKKTIKSVKEIVAAKQTIAEKDPFKRLDELRDYLVAICDFLSGEDREIFVKELEAIDNQKIPDLKKTIPANKLSSLSFFIEDSFADWTDKNIKNELNTKLKEYKLLSVRTHLTEQKNKLFAAENNSNQSEVDDLIAEVTNLQKKLSQIAAEDDVFMPEKTD